MESNTLFYILESSPIHHFIKLFFAIIFAMILYFSLYCPHMNYMESFIAKIIELLDIDDILAVLYH